MTVGPDSEQGFRVEGLFEITPLLHGAEEGGVRLVAGVRFNPDEISPRRIPFEYAWAA